MKTAARLALDWDSAVPADLHRYARRVGKSVEGRPIDALQFGGRSRGRLILGGFHGDEPKGVYLARRLCERLAEQTFERETRSVTIVPLVNPDGYARRNRRNANGVDLNRNFPTENWSPGPPRRRYYGGRAPASEPECRALIDLIEATEPADIITVHSIGDRRFCNNFDGPAGKDLAHALASHNRYPVIESIGYPTPGSFGYWAGVERSIPMVTLELPSHHSSKRCWEDNRLALMAGCD